MGIYNFDEGAFELPGRWSDQSVNALGHPTPDGSNVGIVITRFQLADGQTAEAFAEKALAEHAQVLRGYELLGRRTTTIGNLPAIEAKFRWIDGNEAMFHYLAYIGYYARVVVITGSSLARNGEELEKLMTRVLSSAKFRER